MDKQINIRIAVLDVCRRIANADRYITVKVGAFSRDFRLSGSFIFKKDIVMESLHKALTPAVNINELKSKIN